VWPSLKGLSGRADFITGAAAGLPLIAKDANFRLLISVLFIIQ